MGMLDDFNKQMQKQSKGFNSMLKKQDAQLKKVTKKQNQDLKKFTNIKIKNLISKEGRVRIPAKRKHEVEEKYKHKCAVCKKTSSQLGVSLQVHHKNMKNSDNRLVNLELLCPNHHYSKHGKGKNPKKQKSPSLFGI